MIEYPVIIQNRAGMHARPSAMVVETVKNFKCSVYLEKGQNRINAKSILGVMTLGAGYGTELKIIADGEDEKIAVEALAGLFNNKFDEEKNMQGNAG